MKKGSNIHREPLWARRGAPTVRLLGALVVLRRGEELHEARLERCDDLKSRVAHTPAHAVEVCRDIVWGTPVCSKGTGLTRPP